MRTFEQNMTSSFLRRRTTLQALQSKLKPKVYEVLWGQLQQDEALFLSYCAEMVEAEDWQADQTIFPQDLPETMGACLDAIDRGIARCKALVQDVRCMRSRLETLRSEIVTSLENR